jgi:hypothetical protein
MKKNYPKDFIEELKTRPTMPAIWNGSGYDLVDTF